MDLPGSLYLFADYSCSTYGANAFGASCGETLANTGSNLFVPLAIGIGLIVAALIALIVMRLQRRAAK